MKASWYLLLVSVSGFSSMVYGQQADVETITVHSSRTNNNSLDIGSNIGWIDSDTVQLVNQQHVNQALVRIPGTWISRGNGQEHLTAIRSPVLTGAGGCGAFFIAQDGISLRAPGFCNVNQLFDANTEQAERIEVLRGPSSTQYGSNAVHGVINIITPNAFDLSKSQLSLSAGAHDYAKGMFTLGKVFEDNAVMVYGNFTHDDGYKEDSGFDQQKVNLIHQYQSDRWQIKNVIAVTNLNQETAGFIRGFEAYKDPELKKQNPNPEAFRDGQSARAYSQINYAYDNSSYVQVTPYLRWTDITFLQHFLPWQPTEENGHYSAGVQAQYAKSYQDIKMFLGVDIDHTKGKLKEVQAREFSPSIPAGSHYDYEVTSRIYSPYGQVQWQATNALIISAGVRYEATEYDYQNNLTDGSACRPEVNNCRFTRPADQQVDYHQWSYQLNGNYAINDQHRLYLQYSNGYRAPQTTELFRLQAGQTVAELDAEKINSVEFGVRGQFSALFYDFTAFVMDKDNFIFQDTNRQNISDGKTKHRGIELALSYSWQNFYASANATLAKHKYDANLTLSRVNILGNEIDTAPEHIGSMQLGWQSEDKQFIELEWVHQGNYYLNPENTAEYHGHNLLNFTRRYGVK